jgi:hypothetical protein
MSGADRSNGNGGAACVEVRKVEYIMARQCDVGTCGFRCSRHGRRKRSTMSCKNYVVDKNKVRLNDMIWIMKGARCEGVSGKVVDEDRKLGMEEGWHVRL